MYLNLSKTISEVRLVKAGFTDPTIASDNCNCVLPFKLTKNLKLSMFQFKINHHILYTCDKLLKAKITDSDSYHVCELKQTVEHLFEDQSQTFLPWSDLNHKTFLLINYY